MNRYSGLTTFSDLLRTVAGIDVLRTEDLDDALADARLQAEAIAGGMAPANPLYYRGLTAEDDTNFYVFYIIGEDKPRAGYIGRGWEYDAWYDFEHDICGSALSDLVAQTTYEEILAIYNDMNESDINEQPQGKVVRIELPEIYWQDPRTGMTIIEVQQCAAMWYLKEILDSGEPMHSDIVRDLVQVYGQ